MAAKCIYQVIISDYNCRQFSREMAIAAKLRHPNLLLFIGATIEGEPVIITELMPTSLRKELEKKKLTNKQVITISRDISCGLNYMHQLRPHPIIHRDISSGNVLLEPLPNGWRAKISDYGSANFTNRIVSTVGPGNPRYSAPEALYPDHHTCKMDVFSLGVLMIEMCLGELPESTAGHRNAQIQRIPHWPDMLTLIRKCIREQPTDRPNASEIMSALRTLQLQTISDHQPLTAEEEGEWKHRATKLQQELNEEKEKSVQMTKELDDLHERKKEKEQELDKLRETLQDEKKREQMEENEEKVMQLRKELEEEKKKSRQLQEEVRAVQDAVLPVIPSTLNTLAEVRYAYDHSILDSTVSQYHIFLLLGAYCY